jgi:hypothetical protein
MKIAQFADNLATQYRQLFKAFSNRRIFLDGFGRFLGG